MTALASERSVQRWGTNVYPDLWYFPIAANTKIYQGAAVGVNPATGNCQPMSATPGLIPAGVADKTYDNVTGSTGLGALGGAAAAGNVLILPGVYPFNVGTSADAITFANIGQDAYFIDDNTVGLTSVGRSRAGVIVGIQANGMALVSIVPWFAGTPVVQGGTYRQVRLVAATALAAYTNVAGVLTANANGALATIDSVAPAVGDRVLLAAGAAGADNAIYIVTSLGSASTPSVLTRAPDFVNGQVLADLIVSVSEGSVYAHTDWKLTTQGTINVGTTALAFYPKTLKATVTLAGGTFTLSNQWILAGAVCFAEDTTAAAATKTVVTAGAGSGSVVFTGTTTDVLAYAILNW